MRLNVLKAKTDGQVHKAKVEFVPDDAFLGVSPQRPVLVFAEFQTLKRDILLRLEFEFFIQTECDLCCKETVFISEVKLTELVKLGGKDADDESYTYTGDEIELDRIVNEAILFALPAQILCRDDCRGLCPDCGADRNKDECNCNKTEE